MGCTKYPVLDDDFLLKTLGVCQDDEERGLVTILDLTGMHVSCLCSLSPEILIKQGNRTYLWWVRPKTNMTLQTLAQTTASRSSKSS